VLHSRNRLMAVIAQAILVATILVGVVSPAHARSEVGAVTGSGVQLDDATDVGPMYVAGSASAGIPGYSQAAWAKTYACAFAGWKRGEIVFWTCSLYFPAIQRTVDSHGGSFANGSHSTPTYYYRSANLYYCTIAYAVYADSSDSDVSQRCA